MSPSPEKKAIEVDCSDAIPQARPESVSVAEAEAAALADFGEVAVATPEAEATIARYGATAVVNAAVEQQAAHTSGVLASAAVVVLALAAVVVMPRRRAKPLPAPVDGDCDYGTHEVAP